MFTRKRIRKAIRTTPENEPENHSDIQTQNEPENQTESNEIISVDEEWAVSACRCVPLPNGYAYQTPDDRLSYLSPPAV